MASSVMRSVAAGALLLAGAAPSLGLTLTSVPARPVEGTPFVLVVALTGSCPFVDSVAAGPFQIVRVRIEDPCDSTPVPRLVDVPIPALTAGNWNFQVSFGNRLEGLSVTVDPMPYGLEVVPPSPEAGKPFLLRFTGGGEECFDVGNPIRDGNLFTVGFAICTFPSSLALVKNSFVVELPMSPLPAGDYAVQVIAAFPGIPLAVRRFQVSSPTACTPSETALCLLGGRYRVEASWRTATAQGAARAHPESDDFGAFSLADPDQLSLFVELIDSCVQPEHAVGVAASGLTNAEVEISVTEVATGQVRRFRNPLGRRFALIVETAALSCPL